MNKKINSKSLALCAAMLFASATNASAHENLALWLSGLREGPWSIVGRDARQSPPPTGSA